MNEYQKYIFKKFDYANNFIFTHCQPAKDESDGSLEQYGVFDTEADIFHIKQDDDIYKTKYILLIEVKSDYLCHFQPFEGVFVRKNNRWEKICPENGQYRIVADFNDRIDMIRFVFTNNIADDYILKLEYTEADKEKYFEKVAKEKKEVLEKTASIKVSTGYDLVNIYFQPCSDEYEHTEIQLYVPKEYVTVGSPYGPVEQPSTWSLIKKCKVPTDDFFQSITGLAYGKYAVILKQFDKANNLLIETDYITFSINKPQNSSPRFGTHNVI